MAELTKYFIATALLFMLALSAMIITNMLPSPVTWGLSAIIVFAALVKMSREVITRLGW